MNLNLWRPETWYVPQDQVLFRCGCTMWLVVPPGRQKVTWCPKHHKERNNR